MEDVGDAHRVLLVGRLHHRIGSEGLIEGDLGIVARIAAHNEDVGVLLMVVVVTDGLAVLVGLAAPDVPLPVGDALGPAGSRQTLLIDPHARLPGREFLHRIAEVVNGIEGRLVQLGRIDAGHFLELSARQVEPADHPVFGFDPFLGVHLHGDLQAGIGSEHITVLAELLFRMVVIVVIPDEGLQFAGAFHDLLGLGIMEVDRPVILRAVRRELRLGRDGLARHGGCVGRLAAQVDDARVVALAHVVRDALAFPDIPLPEGGAGAPVGGDAIGIHPHTGSVGTERIQLGAVRVHAPEGGRGQVRSDIQAQELVHRSDRKGEPADAVLTAAELIVAMDVLAGVDVGVDGDGRPFGLPSVGAVGLGHRAVLVRLLQVAFAFIDDFRFRFGFHGDAVVLEVFLGMARRQRERGEGHVYEYLFHIVVSLCITCCRESGRRWPRPRPWHRWRRHNPDSGPGSCCPAGCSCRSGRARCGCPRWRCG